MGRLQYRAAHAGLAVAPIRPLARTALHSAPFASRISVRVAAEVGDRCALIVPCLSACTALGGTPACGRRADSRDASCREQGEELEPSHLHGGGVGVQRCTGCTGAGITKIGPYPRYRRLTTDCYSNRYSSGREGAAQSVTGRSAVACEVTCTGPPTAT